MTMYLLQKYNNKSASLFPRMRIILPFFLKDAKADFFKMMELVETVKF